ncbi:cytochrome c556 [Rhodoferax ferrireducens]|uniref:Cytochrome c556 n=1 Tax=Rhodoferax ferrireducens TaxID=192843 RepID=A0ABU2CEW3_9BURK|nr:cytochrome c [Rhodoferax ferrireducens]MDR7379858.1 cytochrome c556 [Rhodoferax ferrireducens]
MQRIASFVLAASALALAGPAAAQFAKPEDAIKYRQSVMFVMSQHAGRIGAMVQGRVPFDAKVATENAEVVAAMAQLPWTAYMPGTDKGGNTKALPEIWTDAAKFKEHGDKLQADSAKLLAATKTGNLDNVKTAFGAVGGNCKSCHDAFRAR